MIKLQITSLSRTYILGLDSNRIVKIKLPEAIAPNNASIAAIWYSKYLNNEMIILAVPYETLSSVEEIKKLPLLGRAKEVLDIGSKLLEEVEEDISAVENVKFDAEVLRSPKTTKTKKK